MSFFLRAPSQSRVGRPNGGALKSFSVRTGKMEDSSGPAVPFELVKPEPSKEFVAAKHFLGNEVQAAREAVSALDRYIIKLNSFEEKAMELLEEAHRALSRVEQAVAIAAAPELIVVACEIKVACHRGLHLYRTYGRYRYLGKLVAIATRSSITAKFDAAIARLTSIIPLDQRAMAVVSEAGATGSWPKKGLADAADTGSPCRANTALHHKEGTAMPESACSTPRALERAATTSNSAAQTVAAAAGVLANLMRSSSNNPSAQNSSNGSNSAQATAMSAAAATAAAVLVRPGTHDKVTAMSLVQPFASLSAAACVWWAVGDKLEFYSSVTQSTTSFAASQMHAVGCITAITLDSAGNVWAGTSKGSVIMRQRRNWEQMLVERSFSSCVRCLAADADSDVVWGGDETGRLAVLRYNDATNKVECTAIILPGRPNAGATFGGLKGRSAPVMTEVVRPKPRSLLRLRHTTSCRDSSLRSIEPAEGPIRTMLVQDDRAWVAGGRSEPWLAVFDAVQGTQLDMWVCRSYGGCMAMTSLLTTAALAERAAAAATAGGSSPPAGGSSSTNVMLGSLMASTVHEDGIGEDPRSSWRLVTGHENGQLLLWNAASDHLQPLVKVGTAGSSPIRAVAALEQQGLLATAHANGDLVLFNRPAQDEDWLLQCATAAPSTAGMTPQRVTDSAGASRRPSSSTTLLMPLASTASAAVTVSAAAAAVSGGGSNHGPGVGLTTIKPRMAVLRSHRCNLAAAAACSYGIVTASGMGAIKLWTADALGREADRVGLLPIKTQMMPALTELGSVGYRSVGGVAPSRLASTAAPAYAGSIDNHARHIMSMPSDQLGRLSSSSADYMQPLLQQQQQQRGRSGSPRPSYAFNTAEQQQLLLLQQQQQLQAASPLSGFPFVHNSVAGQQQPSSWQQQVQQQLQQPWQQQLPGQSFYGAAVISPRGSNGIPVTDHTSQPSSGGSASSLPVQRDRQQLPELSRRSAPPETPSDLMAAQAGTNSASMPSALMQLTHAPCAQPGSTDFTSSLGAATHGGFMAASSAGSSFAGAAGLLASGFAGSPVTMPDVIIAPRAPKALRDEGSAAAGGGDVVSRERRKSERRLSKGAQMQWSSCQMIDSSELKLVSSIGSGAYGKVWLAEWMGTQVAVKELMCFQDKAKDEVHKRKGRLAKQPAAEDDSGSDSEDSIEEEVQQELKELMSEVFLLGSLTHPSISRFCALCLDPPMIVMQYYSHGSMYELLKRGRRGDKRAVQELAWPKRLNMLRDVASGMVFLHSRRPPIVHGDLRSPNLLLDYTVDRDRGRYHVKIADFGLARMLGPSSHIAVSKVTNPRWSAPEVIRSSTVSRGADVFSFAIVMWEMLTWQQPYEEMLSVQVLFSIMQQTRPEVPPERELPGSPGSQLPKYIALMEACWQEDSAARPTFEAVVSALDDMRAVDCAKQGRTGAGSSRRVSYVSETGTPTCGTPTHFGTPTDGSFCGGSPESSLPGSAANSAPTSAGAAAAAAAAAAAVHPPTPCVSSAGSSRNATSLGSTRPGSPYAAGADKAPADSATSILDPTAAMLACHSADNVGLTPDRPGPTGTISAWRLAAQSDPGTSVMAGSSSLNGGITPGTLGDRRLHLAGVGSSPAGSSLTGAASTALGPLPERSQPQQVQQQLQQQQQQQSPTATCPMSGSMGTPSGSGSPGTFAAYAEPSFAVQLGGPGLAAMGGGVPLMVQVPPPVARTPSRLGPTRTSGSIASPNARDAIAAVTAVGPAAVLHVHGLAPINTGCNSSTSSAAGQASPSARSSSPFSATAGPPSPSSPHHKGMSAYSAFAAAAGPPAAAEVSSTMADAAIGGTPALAVATAGGASPSSILPVKRPASPFSAVQEQQGAGSEHSSCHGSPRPPVSRPTSPFASVQAEQPLPADPQCAGLVQRPASPFAESQHQHLSQVQDTAVSQQLMSDAVKEVASVGTDAAAGPCQDPHRDSLNPASPEQRQQEQQANAAVRVLAQHRPDLQQLFQSRGSLHDSLGAHSPFGLMQPSGSDSVASPVASPTGSFSAAHPGSVVAPAAAAAAGGGGGASHLAGQPLHHGPSRLGASSAARAMPAVQCQQQPAVLSSRVSPFTTVTVAAVQGPIVSQSVLKARAATTVSVDGTASSQSVPSSAAVHSWQMAESGARMWQQQNALQQQPCENQASAATAAGEPYKTCVSYGEVPQLAAARQQSAATGADAAGQQEQQLREYSLAVPSSALTSPRTDADGV